MRKLRTEVIANPQAARSDDLVDLREICRALSDYLGFELVGAPPVLNLIVDANVVLQHLGYLVRERRNVEARPAIQEVADAGVVRLFAPLWLVKEVEEKIPKFAERRGIDESLLRRAWTAYQPQLYLFFADGTDELDIVDPKDRPYASAQRSIAADAVVTEDPHLLESSVPTLLTKLTHKELREWARNRAVSDSMAVAGYGTALTGVGIAGGLATELGKVVRKRPWLAAVIGVGGTGLWWWHRRATREGGQSPLASFVRGMGSALDEFVEAYQSASTRATANMNTIREQIGHSSRTLSQWLLTACIVARKPVREEHLFGLIWNDGFRMPEDGTRSRTGTIREERAALEERARQEIGRTLRSDPRFRFAGTGWTTTLLPSAEPIPPKVEMSSQFGSAPQPAACDSKSARTPNRPKRGPRRPAAEAERSSRTRKAKFVKSPRSRRRHPKRSLT